MRILVTGSAGHLGEALLRVLRSSDDVASGLDLLPSPYTDHQGSILDAGFVRDCMRGVDAVIHTATLHKPHLITHKPQDFIDVNLTGTQTLLDAARAEGVSRFIYTSTTSVFGRSLIPPSGQSAAWITEDTVPAAKNIYGVTKLAAENLCELIYLQHALPCIVLRTSRFFPEDDDDQEARTRHTADNLKVNELLYRRADLEDVVSAHLLALKRAPAIGFDRFIISATTPFDRADVPLLRTDVGAALKRHFSYEAEYARRNWTLEPAIDRVYINERARSVLRWLPRYDFGSALTRLKRGQDYRSPLARAIGAKGYHAKRFTDGPYPTA